MIDVSAEAERDLQGLSVPVCYRLAVKEPEIPSVTYSEVIEKPSFYADNTEQIQRGILQVDTWSRRATECFGIAREISEKLTAQGWTREYSAPIPEPEKDVFHRAMRFVKEWEV